MLFGEMATGPPSSFPIFATIAACIGIIGPAIIGVFTQWKTATLKTNQDQLHEVVKDCKEQAAKDKAELRAEIRDLENRLREAERLGALWEARYQNVIAKSRDFPTSPPKSGPG